MIPPKEADLPFHLAFVQAFLPNKAIVLFRLTP
jgi:hypothetical protein